MLPLVEVPLVEMLRLGTVEVILEPLPDATSIRSPPLAPPPVLMLPARVMLEL